MTLLINTLTNVISQIAKSAQLATLVPASILVLCNLLFMFPALDIDIGDSVLQIGLVVLTIAISYLLWLLNGPFVKLLEGYPFEGTRLARWMTKNQRDDFDILEKSLEECQTQLERAENWLNNILPMRYFGNPSDVRYDPQYKEICHLGAQWQVIQSRYLEERFTHFPPDPEYLLPTRLGNTVSAFEHYPHLRYGINSPVLWPRLVHILDKNGFAAYVEREKSTFDFALNLTVIIVLLGLECIGFAALFLQPSWLWGTAVAVPLVIIAHHALITNAVYWGDMVKVGFDLYRHDLRQALLMRRPDSLADEKQLWKNISNFLATGQSPPSTTWDYDLLKEKEKSSKREPGKEESRKKEADNA